jgi:hypothetical protein
MYMYMYMYICMYHCYYCCCYCCCCCCCNTTALCSYLDRTLIALCQRLGDYRKDDETSFNLAPQLSLFPQFLFNLRRSQFIQVFGNSPDETSYAWIVLNREWTSDAIVMIQPSLTAYSFQAPPEAVLLDVGTFHVAVVVVVTTDDVDRMYMMIHRSHG